MYSLFPFRPQRNPGKGRQTQQADGPAEGQPRTPTVSFTMEGYAPEQVTEVFGSKGINSWHGDFYAVEAVAALGLAESGGLIRLGMAPYCTESDIDRVLNTVAELARNR